MSATAQLTRHSPDAVAGALLDEARLLDMLAETFRRQREGIARDDAAAIDDAVYAAHRIMHTMTEARRRRHALVERLAGTPDIELSDLSDVLGTTLTEPLREALHRIQHAATALAAEVDTNRRLLSLAMAAGDRQIRVLCGMSHRPAAYDARAAVIGSAAPAGAILNRHG